MFMRLKLTGHTTNIMTLCLYAFCKITLVHIIVILCFYSEIHYFIPQTLQLFSQNIVTLFSKSHNFYYTNPHTPS